MSLAQPKFAAGTLRARFGVIDGGRKHALAAKPALATPLETVSSVVPSLQRRFRGFRLVSGAQKVENSAEKVESFDQARRIVAQVEWEIEQQAARERTKNMRRWQPLTLGMEQVAKPVSQVRAVAGIERLRRFFGL